MTYSIRAVTTGLQKGPDFDLLADAVAYATDNLALTAWYYDLFDGEASQGDLNAFLPADAIQNARAKLRAKLEEQERERPKETDRAGKGRAKKQSRQAPGRKSR